MKLYFSHTNSFELERDEVIELYKSRDKIEKLFDIIKNELDIGRLRIHSREALIGRIFLVFLSLILYSSVYSLMKEANLYSKYTYAELFQQLKKLRQIESISGKKYLTEITKKQREIYDGFKISLP